MIRQRLSQTERCTQLPCGALDEAANAGLGRLTSDGVARECGVAVPTAFSYFENRSTLVVATGDEVTRFVLELAGIGIVRRSHRLRRLSDTSMLMLIRTVKNRIALRSGSNGVRRCATRRGAGSPVSISSIA